jgi:hypothetical protein
VGCGCSSVPLFSLGFVCTGRSLEEEERGRWAEDSTAEGGRGTGWTAVVGLRGVGFTARGR